METKMKAFPLVVLIVLLPTFGFGQATYDTACDANGGTNPETCAANVANVANRVILLPSFTSNGGGGTPDTLTAAPTFDSVSSTRVSAGGCSANPAYSATSTFGASAETYALTAPNTGNKTASWSYSGSQYHEPVAIAINGVDQAAPIRDCNVNVVNDASGTTALSCQVSGAQSGDLVVSIFAQLSSTGSFSAINAASGTLQHTGTSLTGIKTFVYTETASGSTTATVTLASARDYLAVCFAIKPASAASGPPMRSLLGVGR